MSSRFSIIPARAIDDNRLSRSALIVLCALGVYGDKGGWCRPSQSTLAKRLGVSRQAVGKGIAELANLGYIEKRRRWGEDGSELPCVYRILFDSELPKGADRYIESDVEAAKDADDDAPPPQPTVAPPATSEVAPPATSEVAPPATSEVAQTPHYNAPLQRPTTTQSSAALAPAPAEALDGIEKRCGEIARQLTSQGVRITATNPDLCQWVEFGITDLELQDAMWRARQRKPAPEQIPAKYLARIVGDVLREREVANRKPPAGAHSVPGASSTSNARHSNHDRKFGNQQPGIDDGPSPEFLEKYGHLYGGAYAGGVLPANGSAQPGGYAGLGEAKH